MKIAVYTDEVHDDFVKACGIISELGITDVCLRRVQSFNIINHPKPEFIADLLRFNGLRAVMLCTDIGCGPTSTIHKQEPLLHKAAQLAEGLSAKFIRIQAGNNAEVDTRGVTKWWLETVNALALSKKFVPLLETSSDSALSSAAIIAAVLAKYKMWGLLYDPANLTRKRAIDPFQNYWTLLSSSVRAVDASDIKDGVYVPPGVGDCKLASALSNFKEWVFLEPNIGMRYKSLTHRDDVFKHCYEALQALLKGTADGSQSK